MGNIHAWFCRNYKNLEIAYFLYNLK
jgi:hypothetical protein